MSSRTCGPDGKAQVTVRYEIDEDGRQRPVEIERVLVSTQHSDGISSEDLIKPDIVERVLRTQSCRLICTTRSG